VDPVDDLSLDWCEGTLPLPDGEIIVVKWQKTNGRPSVMLTLPTGWKRDAALPAKRLLGTIYKRPRMFPTAEEKAKEKEEKG